ncbi:MAG: alpha-glucan phosphorylase, partial [Firmicutes bacterium CAG:272_52_7]
EAYRAVCITVRELLVRKNHDFRCSAEQKNAKKVFYMSMEFLVGTSLRNNLFNLGIEDEMRQAVAASGKDLDRLIDIEPDAGLGNGGLGRLASCYMDAASGLDISCTGFSIKYEFGIFRQKIVGGWQMEFPDDWLTNGGVWLVPRTDDAVPVKFGGEAVGRFDGHGKYRVDQKNYSTVMAVPYDMFISGYDSSAVNRLTLWEAKSPNSFDMAAFSRGEYAKALEQETMAEVISKVLYPADNHIEGKRLRLRQQYFFVSASLQTIVADHMKQYGTLDSLPDKVAIHINDTHPALCVPELMRLLVDEHDYDWDKAWDITCRTLSYTNHAVMSEALEHWSESLYSEQMPRIYQITAEINRRLMIRLRNFYGDDRAKLDYMAVIANGDVRMANLCLACCHMINGVSALHTSILEKSLFRDYYVMDESRFTNVTNGIAYRRWLCQSNPELTALLSSLIGDGFVKDSRELEKFLAYRDDGTVVSPDSIFDVQIKRLHEYKRQLLNVLQILHMYVTLKENPSADFVPRTFVFAAKASPGYVMAKQIIRLIVEVSAMLASDPVTRDRLRVVFLEDYRVSLAEKIIPAADISEQISVAGKEASGTGNMKLMINGAVTLGTLDGANVEIHGAVGDDNMFLFGMTADEVEALWRRGYNPMEFINRDPELKAVMDLLMNGINGSRFDDIVCSLIRPGYGPADAYMSMADFSDYVRAQNDVSAAYTDRERFAKMALVNIAKAGIFSADRAVSEYADRIWRI